MSWDGKCSICFIYAHLEAVLWKHTKGKEIVFRSGIRRGGRTSVMFTQTRGRGNQGGSSPTPGRNLPQGYPVTGRDGKLNSYTEWFSCHWYGNSSKSIPYKPPKEINLEMTGVMLIQNGYVILKLDTFGHLLYIQRDKKFGLCWRRGQLC